ncbi:hypothetical protein SAMD00019534_080280 [Acytostelium subglobosum LB1]|uniref:hypothetical protein n=1 Tax=Acytostelium subglobosum LB1 TaxID=1410327 RepID=UPI0006450BF3|nr:hypothetical protein SAMD00019534_080280 [Acytostelium subglobosum LB1]GAM24853.1 hypothetical protein SAMD00019534_080280 [Acytostelium subglobosum LB1]|eukprot:XP_012751942.1 hypothetical protein SAMD00019534_080280 [Acytostelium subglobosum LB1]
MSSSSTLTLSMDGASLHRSTDSQLETTIKELNQRLEQEKMKQASIERENLELKRRLQEIQKVQEPQTTSSALSQAQQGQQHTGNVTPPASPPVHGTVDHKDIQQTISKFEEQVLQLKEALTKRGPSSDSSSSRPTSSLPRASTSTSTSTSQHTAYTTAPGSVQHLLLQSKVDTFEQKLSSIRNILVDLSGQARSSTAATVDSNEKVEDAPPLALASTNGDEKLAEQTQEQDVEEHEVKDGAATIVYKNNEVESDMENEVENEEEDVVEQKKQHDSVHTESTTTVAIGVAEPEPASETETDQATNANTNTRSNNEEMIAKLLSAQVEVVKQSGSVLRSSIIDMFDVSSLPDVPMTTPVMGHARGSTGSNHSQSSKDRDSISSSSSKHSPILPRDRHNSNNSTSNNSNSNSNSNYSPNTSAGSIHGHGHGHGSQGSHGMLSSISSSNEEANEAVTTFSMKVVSLNENVVKEGILKKKGGGEGGRRNWTTRWFRLKVDTLAYYKKRTGTSPKGVIKLKGARVETHSGKPFGIVLLSGMNEKNIVRDYLLMASSKKEQEEWIVAINDVITKLALGTPSTSSATTLISTTITNNNHNKQQ